MPAALERTTNSIQDISPCALESSQYLVVTEFKDSPVSSRLMDVGEH